MELSVIIVNWNTSEMLKNCLYSIEETKGNIDLEIIVVDNASSDGSREMINDQFPTVRLINSGGNIGFARANNLAIPYAKAPLVFFLNPDTVVKSNAIRLMIDFLTVNVSVAGIGCKIKDLKGKVQNLGLQWFPTPFTEFVDILLVSEKTINKIRNLVPFKDPKKSDYVSKLYGACLMVRKDVLDQIGYFDERFFMYGEDVDLCMRIVKKGWKLYYLSEAEIIHLSGGSSKNAGNHFSYLMMSESISQLMEKYHGKLGRFLYRIVIFVGSNVRLLLLLMLRSMSKMRVLRQNSDYRASFDKYVAMVRWSMNIEKPIVKE